MSPVPLRPADLWDGFGLWLALTEPGAARLVTRHEGPDLHLVLIDHTGLAVVPHGPTGDAAARRMLAALDAWYDAGVPGAADWNVTVHPRGPVDEPGPRRVLLPHARVDCVPGRPSGRTGAHR